jgi:hypothetical protein
VSCAQARTKRETPRAGDETLGGAPSAVCVSARAGSGPQVVKPSNGADAERTNRGHADPFWAITLACLRERGPNRSSEAEVGVRVLG